MTRKLFLKVCRGLLTHDARHEDGHTLMNLSGRTEA
jgi:hypothetical protein